MHLPVVEAARIAGFGTLWSRPCRARRGRNAHTGESFDIVASDTPSFKTGKTSLDSRVSPPIGLLLSTGAE